VCGPSRNWKGRGPPARAGAAEPGSSYEGTAGSKDPRLDRNPARARIRGRARTAVGRFRGGCRFSDPDGIDGPGQPKGGCPAPDQPRAGEQHHRILAGAAPGPAPGRGGATVPVPLIAIEATQPRLSPGHFTAALTATELAGGRVSPGTIIRPPVGGGGGDLAAASPGERAWTPPWMVPTPAPRPDGSRLRAHRARHVRVVSSYGDGRACLAHQQ